MSILATPPSTTVHSAHCSLPLHPTGAVPDLFLGTAALFLANTSRETKLIQKHALMEQ